MANLDENKIRAMIQEEIRRNESAGRFGFRNIPNHTHNGIDSVPVNAPTLSYAAYVPYDAGADPLLGYMLPSGWTVVRQSAGSYLITHNLNTNLYSIVACAVQSTNEKVACVINPFSSAFEVNWFKLSDNSAADTSFNFTLTQINNRSVGQPVYKTLNIT